MIALRIKARQHAFLRVEDFIQIAIDKNYAAGKIAGQSG